MIHSAPEQLYFKHILEGLIHNLNSPLNLILGFAQQLQKSNPELEKLHRILDAGLGMDDILRKTYLSFLNRINPEKQDLDLAQWVSDEICYLTNNLEIKHQCIFQYSQASNPVPVHSSALLLSFTLESLITLLLQKTSIRPLHINLQVVRGELELSSICNDAGEHAILEDIRGECEISLLKLCELLPSDPNSIKLKLIKHADHCVYRLALEHA